MVFFCKLFLFFIIYSFIGWCMEVIVTFRKEQKFINCGILIGPYCPIYGLSAVLVLNTLDNFKSNPVALFILAVIVCSTIEYIASYLLEKALNIKWWDYSNYKFNLNGRICLNISLIFGFLSIIFSYVIHPVINNSINILPTTLTMFISIVLMIVFMFDIKKSYSIIKTITKKNSFQLDIYTDKITEIIKPKKKSI